MLRRGHSTLLVLLIALAVVALDFNKAFHIDDTFHLKAAQWIAHDPLHPMSGTVNWGNSPEPIHFANQPAGFFYLVALTGQLFGYTEWPMHAMRGLFTLLAVFCFHRLAREKAPGQALWLTALFAFCPAFMVNQGLMTDVPLLALILLHYRLLLAPVGISEGWRHFWAAMALGAALLVKYTALPLLMVFPLAILARGQRRWLPMALVPVAVLAAWSLWNVWDYGGVHLFGRPSGDLTLMGITSRSLGMLTALGAVAPFTPVFLPAFAGRRLRGLPWWWLLAMTAFACWAWGVWHGHIPEAASDQLLRISFTLNGLYLVLFCIFMLYRRRSGHNGRSAVVVLWASALAVFIALFSPFIATRHLLLLVPPLLLIGAPALRQAGTAAKIVAVVATALLGTLLTISDKHYADFYRRMVPVIASEMAHETTGTLWNTGHWGMQWYAGQAGLPTYDGSDRLKPGDMIIVPEDHDAVALPEGLAVDTVASWSEAPGGAVFFSVEQFASMYTSSYEKLPWRLSRAHRKQIWALRAKD